MDDGLPPYIGFAGLWRLETEGLEIQKLGPMLEARLARDPQNAEAMMDIATLSILTLIPENRPVAFELQAKALALRQVYRIAAASEPPALRVLAIACPGDMTALTHIDCLLEGSDVELKMLYVTDDSTLPDPLPEHDLVFVVAGDSPSTRPILDRIAKLASKLDKPVLNRPERVLRMSRDSVSGMLRTIGGVAMPATLRVGRADFQKVAGPAAGSTVMGATFPLIVRPEDSQGGKDLAKVDDPAALSSYLDATRGDGFFVSPFVDYCSSDGQYRKYRVVMVDGRPYAGHMAVSGHWMIHYVNADMDQSVAKRQEEERFFEEFDTGFAQRHARALAAIDSALGLDYYAIDCAETRRGELLVFEADTAMLVHSMDPVDLYPYKRPAMERIFRAFRAMLEHRSRSRSR